MLRRPAARGFIIFVAIFWGIVACLLGVASFFVPAYWGRGCLTRILFGLGGVVGLFASLISTGLASRVLPPEIGAVVVFAGLGAGVLMGAVAGARLAELFGDVSSPFPEFGVMSREEAQNQRNSLKS